MYFLHVAMCTLQPKTGPCRTFIESYFWNVTTRRCERFTYGGCGGNFNRFSDIKSCANQCGKQIPVCCSSYRIYQLNHAIGMHA